MNTGDSGCISSEEWYDEEDFPSSVLKAEQLLKNAGIPVQKRREHADRAETIIATAEDICVDRIIICGRNQTPVGKVLFGSVTQSVLLNVTTPVTVVPN